MRPIDADALLEKMEHRKEYIGRPSDPVCLVEDAPTIDAVEVVRCKDCQYCEKWEHDITHEIFYFCHHGNNKVTNADGYCSEGVKRDADD